MLELIKLPLLLSNLQHYATHMSTTMHSGTQVVLSAGGHS